MLISFSPEKVKIAVTPTTISSGLYSSPPARITVSLLYAYVFPVPSESFTSSVFPLVFIETSFAFVYE